MLLLLVVWLLLNNFFIGYITENIGSEAKFCEAFENVPLIGSVRCPS
jgi:hypothetical protein